MGLSKKKKKRKEKPCKVVKKEEMLFSLEFGGKISTGI